MIGNKLQLNSDKTECLLFDTRDKLKSKDVKHLHVGHDIVPFNAKARNLGVFFDHQLSMETHINHLCKQLYLEMRRIGAMVKFLDETSKKTLVSAFILSRLDYCNSLFLNLPNNTLDRLQKSQNNAARMIMNKKKRDHVTSIFRHLHWLPVRSRIQYKVSIFCFKCLNGSAPSYLSDLVPLYTPSRSLRSSGKHLITEQTSRLKKFGDRSFKVAAPKIWNSLPQNLRSCTSEKEFRRKLKTHLFNK